jgi:glycosyltransferase involved in cell wall biosynthesis
MGSGVSPRVTYWTGTWDPAREAISKEINTLRTGNRSASPVVSLSPRQSIRLSFRDRVLMLPDRAWPLLRGVAALVEPRGNITHVFGGRGVSWHLLRALGRRPIVLTAVVASTAAPGGLPATRIAKVVIENESSAAEWVASGISRERIRLIRPGIDLDWYAPAGATAPGRFTLLFASTPPDPAEIGPRGIPLLVELARLRPDIDVVLLWRNWGDVDAARRALNELRPPANFLVKFGDVADLRPHYAAAHATIVCFESGIGKTCPSFVIEGLASARPCISTAEGGLAGDLDRSGAGLAVPRDAASLARAVDLVRADWIGFSGRARRLAEDQFSLRRFRAGYDELYDQVLLESASAGP